MTTNDTPLYDGHPVESLSINDLHRVANSFKAIVSRIDSCSGSARMSYQSQLANMMAKWGGVIIQAALNDLQVRPFGLIEARKQAAEKAKEFDYNRHAEIVRGIGIQMQNAECEADFKEHYYRLMDECGVLQAGVSKDCPRDFFNRHQIIKGKRLYNTQIKALAHSIHYKYKGPAIDGDA